MNFETALSYAKEYYTTSGLEHALRVVKYVEENKGIPQHLLENCRCLAVMHDLIEDTEFDLYEWLDESEDEEDVLFSDELSSITKYEEETYDEYINYIKERYNMGFPISYYVKLADIKDHLMLKNTLTDRLKEKYIRALRILL